MCLRYHTRIHVQYFTYYNDIHSVTHTNYNSVFDIIWQIRVLPGTRNILKRVFMGTFVTQSVLLHLILVVAKRRKIRQKFKNSQKFGYLRR